MLTQELSDAAGVRVTVPPEPIGHSYYKYYFFVKPEALREGWDRDRIVAEISARGACLLQRKLQRDLSGESVSARVAARETFARGAGIGGDERDVVGASDVDRAAHSESGRSCPRGDGGSGGVESDGNRLAISKCVNW